MGLFWALSVIDKKRPNEFTTSFFRTAENDVFLKCYSHVSIINRLRNGYETASNIKVVSINSFRQLEVTIKSVTSQSKVHVCFKHGFGSYINMVSILLDEDIYLEEETTHFFNEQSIFTFQA